MSFTIDEDAISELVGDPNSSTSQQLEHLRAWIRDTLDTGNYHGNPDFGLIQKKLAASLNNASDKITMLALKHQLKLNGLQKNLDVARRTAYENAHSGKARWTLTEKGEEIMVNGDPDLADAKERYENEKAFLKMLETYQKMILFFPKNIETLMNAHNFGERLGQVTVTLPEQMNQWGR